MMVDLLIKNGIVVFTNEISKVDIAITDGKISAILAPDHEYEAKTTISAEGKLIFPGAIDTHAHLNDPGYNWREDYEHGTAAAAIGGITTIIDMPMQNEPALTNAKIFDEKERKVSPNAYVDYCYWGGLVDYNFNSLEELDKKGCVAFKSFIGPVSPDYASLSYGQALEALKILSSFGARAGFHCEDYSIIKWEEEKAKAAGKNSWKDFLNSRPVVAELIATKAIIDLAKVANAKIHICHVSHPCVAQVIKDAQKEGLDVTGETCGHYLCFTDEDVIQNGALFKCAPPLRTKSDMEAMWKYVEDGTLSCIGSDHSPCAEHEKNTPSNVFDVWGGISGIQNLFQVIYSEGIDKRGYCPTIISRSLSEGPAKAFGLYGKKGSIQVGFDADLIILDPNKQWEITSESLQYVNKISAFVGLKGKGCPICTILRGNVIAKNGIIIGEKGFGTLVTKYHKEFGRS